MHPFEAQVHSQAIMDERHREAADWRTARAAHPVGHRPGAALSIRLGGMLVRLGTRLQSRPRVPSTMH